MGFVSQIRRQSGCLILNTIYPRDRIPSTRDTTKPARIRPSRSSTGTPGGTGSYRPSVVLHSSSLVVSSEA